MDATALQTLGNASFTFGHWDEQTPKGFDIRTLSKQMRRFIDNGFTAANNSALVLYTQTVSGTAGLYMGKSVSIQATASNALVAMEDALYVLNNTGGSAALQLCGDGYDCDHVFGFIATSNTSFTPVQQTLQSWSNATCLTFNVTQDIITMYLLLTYCQEPDIPGIPAGNDDDGTNYLAFLVVLKNLLPGKTVSIAAAASYWYLRQFSIAQISKVVDYIVFMTYDLHGQWDAGNQCSQEGL